MRRPALIAACLLPATMAMSACGSSPQTHHVPTVSATSSASPNTSAQSSTTHPGASRTGTSSASVSMSGTPNTTKPTTAVPERTTTPKPTTAVPERAAARTSGADGYDPNASSQALSNANTGLDSSERAALAAPLTGSAAGAGGITRLVIPSIGLNARIVADPGNGGVLSPPSGVAEWYSKSPKPGTPGNSIVVGHITWNGPDVFYRLPRIAPGAAVSVIYANGQSKTFHVERKQSINKDSAESDQAIYGATSATNLILVTCDPDSTMIGGHHVNNYVVWTH